MSNKWVFSKKLQILVNGLNKFIQYSSKVSWQSLEARYLKAQHEQNCCVTSWEFDAKRAAKPKFVAQSKTHALLSITFFSPQQMFLLLDMLIMRSEKGKTLTQNLQWNNGAWQVGGFWKAHFSFLSLPVDWFWVQPLQNISRWICL